MFYSSFPWVKTVPLGCRCPYWARLLFIFVSFSSFPPRQIDPQPGKVSLDLLGLLGVLFSGRPLTKMLGRDRSFCLGLYPWFRFTSLPYSLRSLTLWPQFGLPRPPRFALNIVSVSTTSFSPSHILPPTHSTRTGNKYTSTPSQAIPLLAINRSWPYQPSILRFNYVTNGQNWISTSTAARTVLLPNSDRFPYVLVPQKSKFIYECEKQKQKPPILLIDAHFSLGSPQNKTSDRDMGS